MANASIVSVSPDLHGLVHLEPTSSTAARTVSDQMHQNHDKHHVYFNYFGHVSAIQNLIARVLASARIISPIIF
jgi:hypothetical protein